MTIQDIDWRHINELRMTGERLARERGLEVLDISTLDDQWTKFYLYIPAIRLHCHLMVENLVGQELLFYPGEAEAKLDEALQRLAEAGKGEGGATRSTSAEVLIGLPTSSKGST